MASGRTCFVPATATIGGCHLYFGSARAETNLKCDMGNTESSLCNLIQLQCVTGGFDVGGLSTDLRKCRADFENLFQSLLRRFTHQWGVVL